MILILTLAESVAEKEEWCNFIQRHIPKKALTPTDHEMNIVDRSRGRNPFESFEVEEHH
jgi:hypothetical protein